MTELPIGQILIGVSFLTFLSWVMILILGWLSVKVWAWVDDQDGVLYNPVIVLCMYIVGCKKREYYNGYGYAYQNKDGGGIDSFPVFIFSLLISAIIPSLLYLCFIFYPIPIAIMILVLLAKLARYARRHKKAFDEHIKDKNAHN